MEKFIHNSIHIEATPALLWDVLTKGEETKKYMFGCETVSDWKEGGELLWKMQHEGKDFIPVKGHIKEIRPNEFLAYTVIDPHNPAIADIPENYLTVTYELKEEKGGTTLNVSQGDYSKVAEGDKRYNESYNNGIGWQPILEKIKEVAESR